MKITILTLFPEMYEGFLNTSMIKRIISKDLVEFKIVDIRDYSIDRYRHVDDTPYGGGAGMLMRVDVAHHAILDNATSKTRVLLTSPKGKKYTQEDAKRLVKEEEILILCGHYEGIDSRIEKYCDEMVSIGDYILTGGELASMVISDSIVRLIEESISPESLKEESFEDGLLEYPQYTRPVEYDGEEVPFVLTNGNHKEIRRFNLKNALKETLKYRPEMLEGRVFTPEEEKLLIEIQEESCEE
ncbi:MAG: tRNA (guanosine(37)-N1)-methyltransferase TrmD [Erysipelotrichaceae bacterium]|nr:tRNA (guanosine(37)-N1)-methyltransferase TrmD [Erysipelotrichaceae bacterium]